MEVYIAVLALIVLVGAIAEVFEAGAERRRRLRNRDLREFPGLEDDDKTRRVGRGDPRSASYSSPQNTAAPRVKSQPEPEEAPSGRVFLEQHRLRSVPAPQSNDPEQQEAALKHSRDQAAAAQPGSSEISLRTTSLYQVHGQVDIMPDPEPERPSVVAPSSIDSAHRSMENCEELRLSPSELEVFKSLYRSEGSPVSCTSLVNELFLKRIDPADEDTLRTLVSQIRSKLPRGVSIETAWGDGYRLSRSPGVEFSWEAEDRGAALQVARRAT